ncbi:MAG: hypothetical protein D6681_09815, partial [Calditrichaeota bacterium]
EELKKKQRSILHLQLAADYQARWNNYEFHTLEDIQKLRESPQFEHIENLTLAGPRWRDVTVRLILDEVKPPALKHVALSGVSLTQEEAYQLIHDYPQYTFEVGLGIIFLPNQYEKAADFNPDYWPRIDIEEED